MIDVVEYLLAAIGAAGLAVGLVVIVRGACEGIGGGAEWRKDRRLVWHRISELELKVFPEPKKKGAKK